MSYFGIGIWHPKHECNIGTLFRSAYAFGASLFFTIGGKKYRRQCSDTPNSTIHVPYLHFNNYDDFKLHRPTSKLIVIELDTKAISLYKYALPRCPILYLLGSEGGGLPQELLQENTVVQIPGLKTCLNVSVAGSIVLSKHVELTGK